VKTVLLGCWVTGKPEVNFSIADNMASGTGSDSTLTSTVVNMPVANFASDLSHSLNASLRLSRLAIAVSCDHYYPKTRLPSHHLRVCGWGFLE
jgi:hypothetical protein